MCNGNNGKYQKDCIEKLKINEERLGYELRLNITKINEERLGYELRIISQRLDREIRE